MRITLSIHLLVILKTIITWWDFPNNNSLVYLISFVHSLSTAGSYLDKSNPPSTRQNCIIYSLSLYYYLFHCLLTNPGYCNQDPVTPVFPIQYISKCMNVIFSQFTIHDSIQESIICQEQRILG